MAKATMTRKQLLKEPDQFITFSGKLIAFGQSHLKKILFGAGGFFALLIITAITLQISDRNENRASERIEKATAAYAAALQDTDAKTAYDRVSPDFTAIFDDYGSTQSAKLARLIYADISYEAGDAETAIAMYRQALNDFSQSAALKNIVRSGLGHAYILKGEHVEAIGIFEMIAADDDQTMKNGALFNLAWLYEETGKAEKSTATYEQLLTEFPDSRYGDLVREKIRG